MSLLCQDGKKRCFGGDPGKNLYAEYHDYEWGIPLHNDNNLFEMLTLEGAQAGLSWETILKRRKGYQKAFHYFDPLKVATMNYKELDLLIQNKEIIRNKLKIYSVHKNANIFLKIQNEFGSFDKYIWHFTDGEPIINNWKQFVDIPITTTESSIISNDLKNRGMTFVGKTIIYAYMQAIGIVNDHLTDCWCRMA